jgi:chaperone required for assembly of F1-ATPase
MYKDPMPIPSRALAVAIAEEWESQHEKIDLKTLHLNQFMTRAIRASCDPSLAAHMQSEVQRILEND